MKKLTYTILFFVLILFNLANVYAESPGDSSNSSGSSASSTQVKAWDCSCDSNCEWSCHYVGTGGTHVSDMEGSCSGGTCECDSGGGSGSSKTTSSGGGGGGTTTNKSTSTTTTSSNENVKENKPTGTALITFVWILGIATIGYSVWYYKKNIINQN